MKEPVQPMMVEQGDQPARTGAAAPGNSALRPSVISDGVRFEGKINSTGSLHLDGEVKGELSLDSLTIGATGKVIGKIKTKLLNIKGTFEGDAACEDLVLSAGSLVNARIRYRTIKIAAGARISGELQVAK